MLSNYVSNGYVTNEYTFSDSGLRNLRLKFLNDSILEVTNRVILEHEAPNNYLWKF